MKKIIFIFFIFITHFILSVAQEENVTAILSKIESYAVSWNTPSFNSKGSMPLGNGDIGINVWAEENGDLMMYISKTDAWSEDVFGNEGILKLGRLRIHFSNNPFQKGLPFLQTLLLTKGEVEIKAGDETIFVWVDANHPVIYIESSSRVANSISIHFESLRSDEVMALKDTLLKSKLHHDSIFEYQTSDIAWLYQNNNKNTAALKNLKFGAIVTGDGFKNQSSISLVSTKPKNHQIISAICYTGTENDAGQWLEQTKKFIPSFTHLETVKHLHENWWEQFWQRSWIFLDGDKEAELVSRTYNLQRYMYACGSRGTFPSKFNGSLFTMDDTLLIKKNGINVPVPVNGDYRSWGGRFWFQNTRHQFWPMLAAGDFEMMMPFFRLYINQIKLNKEIVKQLYGFDALIFGEQQPFWGGLPNGIDKSPGSYGFHYFSQIMEFSAMMLDYYDYTGDCNFLQKTVIPIANDGLRFYTNRFKKDNTGKLIFEPANAMETFWKVKNPSSEIAGYRYVLQRLLELPHYLIKDYEKQWHEYLSIAPDIPIGVKNNKPVILASQTSDAIRHNTENPELYPIFPFRLYGLNKPGLVIAMNTFDERINKRVGCWHHDLLSAALLGKIEDAKIELVNSCTYSNAIDQKNNNFRFIGFLGPGHDYGPDMDHGGVIIKALQLMVLQECNRQPILFPCFPSNWNANFKLRSSGNETVYATYRNGKIINQKIIKN